MTKANALLPGEPFVHRSIKVAGYALHYAEAGTGPAVVSIPGSAGIEPSIAKDMLSVGHRVIEINPPGWGEVDDVVGTMELKTLAALMAEAIAMLVDEQFALIGTSMGGTTATWLAKQFPERVRALLLEGPELFVRPDDRRVTGAGGATIAEQVRRGVAEDDLVYPQTPLHPRKFWATPGYNREQMRRRFRMFRHFTNHAVEELRTSAPQMATPMLCLLGDEDEVIRTSVIDQWASCIPQAEVRIVLGGRHDLQNTQPEMFAETATDFFAANPGR